MSKELRDYANRERKRRGKKNGVVSWLYDHPSFDVRDANNKRTRRRKDDRKIIQQELDTYSME